jgi:tRNA A37 methylthiotransferase MiaB
MKKKAVLLIDFIGCPRNMLLKLRFEDYLKANGWEIAPAGEVASADLVALLGCGLMNKNRRQTLRIIEAVKKQLAPRKDNPVLVVTGCIPSQYKADVEAIHSGPSFGPRELEKFDEVINATTSILDIPTRNRVRTSERVPAIVHDRKRVDIVRIASVLRKVIHACISAYYGTLNGTLFSDVNRGVYPFDYYQMGDDTWCIIASEGCLGNCSYCIGRLAKGRLKSRPLEEIVESARQGVKQGYKWISLIAEDNGVYGRDIGLSFGTLLRELTSIEGDFGLLIDSMNPKDMIELCDDFPDVFATGKIRRLCLAVQHVSPRIVKSMNRSYDLDRLKRCLEAVTAASPSFYIDAHFIIGYPGETEEEFRQLKVFAEWLLGLNPLHSFKPFAFSASVGTKAAQLPDQISTMTTLGRILQMDRLCLKHRYRKDRRRRQLDLGEITA